MPSIMDVSARTGDIFRSYCIKESNEQFHVRQTKGP